MGNEVEPASGDGSRSFFFSATRSQETEGQLEGAEGERLLDIDRNNPGAWGKLIIWEARGNCLIKIVGEATWNETQR